MDKLRSRKCPNCDDVGHSSLDCPKLGNSRAGGLPEFGTDVGIKLRVSNRESAHSRLNESAHSRLNESAHSRLSDPDVGIKLRVSNRENRESVHSRLNEADVGIKLRVSNRENRESVHSRLNEADDKVRGPAHSRLSQPAKINKLLERSDNSRTESFLRGEGKFEERPLYQNIAIKAKRTRLVQSDSESDGRGHMSDEPLTIQVDYGKPKKSKRRSSERGVRRSLNAQKSAAKPGDLRYQMKSRPLDAPLIPQYKTKEDLRFSIKRPTTESKRKKTRPPRAR